MLLLDAVSILRSSLISFIGAPLSSVFTFPAKDRYVPANVHHAHALAGGSRISAPGSMNPSDGRAIQLLARSVRIGFA